MKPFANDDQLKWKRKIKVNSIFCSWFFSQELDFIDCSRFLIHKEKTIMQIITFSLSFCYLVNRFVAEWLDRTVHKTDSHSISSRSMRALNFCFSFRIVFIRLALLRARTKIINSLKIIERMMQYALLSFPWLHYMYMNSSHSKVKTKQEATFWNSYLQNAISQIAS